MPIYLHTMPPARELPPLTAKNILLDVVAGARALVYDPFANRIVIPVLVLLASILCKVVVRRVAYTEIDFSTYMQQVAVAAEGELDYSEIAGDTGPAVYPAGFLQVYLFLLSVTNGGEDIAVAQLLFGYLFTVTVALACATYTMSPGLAPWPLYLLLCSKRLVSIYVLRLFNDCFTTVGMVAVVLTLQQAAYFRRLLGRRGAFWLCVVAADIYSLALLVKMNALLYLPAFAYVVFLLLDELPVLLAAVCAVIPAVQVMVGWRYLLPMAWDEEARYLRWTYLRQAFDFLRGFLYEWTVNWRFVDEKTFASRGFANALVVLHVSLLVFFLATRFVRASGRSFGELCQVRLFGKDNRFHGEHAPRVVLAIFGTTNLVGVLCARSLHYQFLLWYCWLLPFLLHAAGTGPLLGAAVFLSHEWCWNVFPATPLSSGVLVSVLAAVLCGLWRNEAVWGLE